MKRIITISLAFIALASCTKETLVENPSAEASDYIFECTLDATKVALGEKEGTAYKAVWEENDSLKVMKAADDTQLGTITLTKGAGTANGTFALTRGAIADGTEVYFAYGSGDVAAVQTRKSAGEKPLLTSAKSDKVKVEAGKTTTFGLKHSIALVKVTLSTTDFADLKLTSLMLYAKGDTIAAGNSDNVCVEFAEPVSLASSQEIWLSALPVAKASDFYVVATMKGDKSTVTIPVLFSGKTLAEGKVNNVKLENLSLSSNSCADWYEPVETRALLGGWAYGPENTYFVCTNDVAGDLTYKFDVKARGDFRKVSKPAYYGFIMFKDRNYNSFLKLDTGYQGEDTFDTAKDNFVPKNDNQTIASDCTFSLISLSAVPAAQQPKTTFAVIGIYDENKDLIWSFMIQRYAKNDPPVAVEYKDLGVSMLDRSLGQTNGSVYLTSLTSSIGDLYSYGALFQWGRKDPCPYVWGNGGASKYCKSSITDKNDANSTIENAIKHPYRFYLLSKTQNWMPNIPSNLWGGTNNTSSWYDPSDTGYKTIYDPCPEGYRVCDGKVLADVAAKGVRWERYSVVSKYHAKAADEAYDHDNKFGGSCIAYPLGDDKYDLWLYSGYASGSTYNAGRTTTGSDTGGLYWANNFTSSGKPGMYQWLCASNGYVAGGYPTGASYMLTVRCQKL